jgi:Glyoxalase-like domain
MSYEFQVVVDSADPHVQADWWAETMGWQVEPQNETFIRKMIAEGHATESDTRHYNGALVWAEGAAIHHPDGLQRAPRVLFQLVPEPKTVKNRLHLDLRIGTDDVEETVEKLTARGAKFLHRGRQGPHTWVTMADPEGNEFCVSQSPPA